MSDNIRIPLTLIVIILVIIFFTGSLCGYMSGYIYRDSKESEFKTKRHKKHDYIIYDRALTHDPNCTCGWNI